MNISFDNKEKISGVLTIVIEEADYQDEVKKQLNDYRKRANIPGFRPGMAPMGLIKKQYGTSVKVDEVNKLLGEKIYEYIRENKIQMLGDPLPNEEKQQPVRGPRTSPPPRQQPEETCSILPAALSA